MTKHSRSFWLRLLESNFILMRSWFTEWKHQQARKCVAPAFKNNEIIIYLFALVASLLYRRSWGDSLSLGSPNSSEDYIALPNIWAWCQPLLLLSNFTSSPSSIHRSLDAPTTRKASLSHPAVNGRGVKVQVAGQTGFSSKTAPWMWAKSNIYTSTRCCRYRADPVM